MVSQRRVDLKIVPGGGQAAAPSPDPSGERGWRSLFRSTHDPLVPGVGPEEAGLRPVDVLILVYLGVTACLMLAFQANLDAWGALTLGHGLAAVALLRMGAGRPPRHRVLRFLRDYYPLIAMALIYLELEFLTQLSGVGPHDAFIVEIEQNLFGSQPSQHLHELWPSWIVSQYLHGAYFIYYLIPSSVLIPLYLQRRWDAFQELLTTLLLTFLSCCLMYIAYPVAGPYHYIGIPDLGVFGGGIAAVAHAIVQSGSSVGTAFPSSHTAISVVIWLSAWRLDRRLFWVLSLVVPALTLGTVYGGFHYAVDTIAGVLWGAAAALTGPGLQAFLARRLPRMGAQQRQSAMKALPKSRGGT